MMNDIARCTGVGSFVCPLRNRCARYFDVELDVEYAWMTPEYSARGECPYFIGDENDNHN